MSDFEVLRNITIGQFIPADSFVHRMDPRAKLLATLFLILAITAAGTIFASLSFVLLMLGITLLAHMSILYIARGLIPILGFLTFLVIFQLIFQGPNVPCAVMWFEWRFVQISPCLALVLVLGLIRVVAFIFIISLLTMTTTNSHLTHGVESLMSPLARIGFPAHEIALALTIALRFIPTLAEELDRIMKAQASRGAEMGERRWWRPDKMIRERLPLLVPLFINALRRAEDLVVAMEARAYLGSKGRTTFVQFHSNARDWLALAFVVLVWVACWWLPWGHWTEMMLAAIPG